MQRRRKYHVRVIAKSGTYRIVGTDYGKLYSPYSSSYRYERFDGEDAMGVKRWVTVEPDGAFIESIAFSLDKALARRKRRA